MNKNYKEVRTDKLESVSYPGILRSGNLEQCIVMGMYNKETRKGYMIREFPLGCNELDEKLNQIEGDCGDLSKLVVCTLGGSSVSNNPELEKFEDSIKDYLENTLKTRFKIENPNILWLSEDVYAELVLDTSLDGKFELHKEN